MQASDLALWRYSLIAPLLHAAPGVSLAEFVRRLAREPKVGPDGAPAFVSADTLQRWYSDYRKHGLPGLENRPRSDRNCRRALDPATIEALHSLATEHAAWTVRAIRERAEKDLGRPLPASAVYRVLAGHRRRARAAGPATRARAIGTPQVLWLADTLCGPWVYGPRRAKRRARLIAFFDDASRAVMGGRFTVTDDVAALLPIFREALLARGLPHRLLVDNGPSYRSRVLRTACATLDIHLVYASPYHPQSKARLERFFGTVRVRFLPGLAGFLTLDALNAAWARFLVEYHAAPHSALTEAEGKPTSPLAYYLTHLPADVRTVREIALDDLLQVEEVRRVSPDGTVRVGGRRFEVDPALAGSAVIVRFDPARPERVHFQPANRPTAPFVPAHPIA